MPCDTIQTNTVDLPKMHPALLAKAIIALGARQLSPAYFLLRGQTYRVRSGEVLSEVFDSLRRHGRHTHRRPPSADIRMARSY